MNYNPGQNQKVTGQNTKWLRHCTFLFYTSISSRHNLIQALIVIFRNPHLPLAMLIVAGILRTVHKHSSVTTLRGGKGAEKDFEIYVANCPIILGQDCSFLIQYGGPYDAVSLVHLRFVAATCCRKCTHGATTLLSLILSLQSITRIQTGFFLSLRSITPRQTGFLSCKRIAAAMIFTKLTASHEAIFPRDVSQRLIA